MLVTQEVRLHSRRFHRLIRTGFRMHPDLILPLCRGYLIPRYQTHAASTYHELFCEGRKSHVFVAHDEKGQFFSTKACELYI